MTDREIIDLLMMKDIYSVGICMIELMIGRFGQKLFSISVDSLPLAWANFRETQPLIVALQKLIDLDTSTIRKGLLKQVRKALIRDYKSMFKKEFYPTECAYVGKRADLMNRRGIVALYNKQEEVAMNFWAEGLLINDRHFDC